MRAALALLGALLCAGGCTPTFYAVNALAGALRPTLEEDWERDKVYTVHAWHRDAPLIPEKTKDHVYKGAERFTANGRVTPHTRDSLNLIAAPLLSALPERERYRIPGETFDKQPRYFINRRLMMVSVEPAVLLLVPARFESRDHEDGANPPGSALGSQRAAQEHADSAYYRLGLKEFPLGFKPWLSRVEHWHNYIEFSAVVPQVEGIEAVSAWWPAPVPLAVALADPRWNFRVEESAAIPGYLHLRPASARQ